MKRWVLFSICAGLGLAMLLCGLIVPAHIKAVDGTVLKQAGVNTTSLEMRGVTLVNEQKLGAAQLLSQAAVLQDVPGREELSQAITNLVKQNPRLQIWGSVEPRLDTLFDARTSAAKSELVTDYLVRPENRARVLEALKSSPRLLMKELVRCRSLTNTTLFPPSQSASGQAFDTALSICGLLADEGHYTPSLSYAIYKLALDANLSGNPQPLEKVLMDLMSMGQRFNWGQLVMMVSKVEDAETLGLLANHVRNSEKKMPVLFSAVQLSGKPAEVSRYLSKFRRTGMADLGVSLHYGTGGVTELLRRDQRLTYSETRQKLAGHAALAGLFEFAADFTLRAPRAALAVKWILLLASGFLIAAAIHFARSAVSALERPLQVRGFHLARELLFALGFLFVVLLLTEPFLFQESPKGEVSFRLRLPQIGSVAPTEAASVQKPNMNANLPNLLTLLFFFVLQGLIYISCLVRLAEIRRQRVPTRLKLKLLENEEHLFDAGLYLGFAGTIVSLILVSMGIAHLSLMAAYGSTSFGIIFVSAFKIFNLRPLRRRMLLEEDAGPVEPVAKPTLAKTT